MDPKEYPEGKKTQKVRLLLLLHLPSREAKAGASLLQVVYRHTGLGCGYQHPFEVFLEVYGTIAILGIWGQKSGNFDSLYSSYCRDYEVSHSVQSTNLNMLVTTQAPTCRGLRQY